MVLNLFWGVNYKGFLEKCLKIDLFNGLDISDV